MDNIDPTVLRQFYEVRMELGSDDRVDERFVDLLQASETMTDTELARLVSEADPATVERIRKVTEAIFRQNRP